VQVQQGRKLTGAARTRRLKDGDQPTRPEGVNCTAQERTRLLAREVVEQVEQQHDVVARPELVLPDVTRANVMRSRRSADSINSAPIAVTGGRSSTVALSVG
jgi:hypothetical protein